MFKFPAKAEKKKLPASPAPERGFFWPVAPVRRWWRSFSLDATRLLGAACGDEERERDGFRGGADDAVGGPWTSFSEVIYFTHGRAMHGGMCMRRISAGTRDGDFAGIEI
jgi:hypothetical protein